MRKAAQRGIIYPCPVCSGENHTSFSCSKFRNESVIVRYRAVMESALCVSCLRPNCVDDWLQAGQWGRIECIHPQVVVCQECDRLGYCQTSGGWRLTKHNVLVCVKHNGGVGNGELNSEFDSRWARVSTDNAHSNHHRHMEGAQMMDRILRELKPAKEMSPPELRLALELMLPKFQEWLLVARLAGNGKECGDLEEKLKDWQVGLDEACEDMGESLPNGEFKCAKFTGIPEEEDIYTFLRYFELQIESTVSDQAAAFILWHMSLAREPKKITEPYVGGLSEIKAKLIDFYGAPEMIIEHKIKKIEGLPQPSGDPSSGLEYWRTFRTAMEEIEEMVSIVTERKLAWEYQNRFVLVRLQRCTIPKKEIFAQFKQNFMGSVSTGELEWCCIREFVGTRREFRRPCT